MLKAGSRATADELFPLAYRQLREHAAALMISERDDHTLEPTALVHEAYLRMTGLRDRQAWANTAHFFAAVAESMRHILIDLARDRKTQKRGGDQQRVELADLAGSKSDGLDLLLNIDEGLSLLAQEDVESAELVKLRLFVGLSVTEAGHVLGMSRSTAYENWNFARCWFAVHFP